jgi:hypothetical protein
MLSLDANKKLVFLQGRVPTSKPVIIVWAHDSDELQNSRLAEVKARNVTAFHMLQYRSIGVAYLGGQVRVDRSAKLEDNFSSLPIGYYEIPDDRTEATSIDQEQARND